MNSRRLGILRRYGIVSLLFILGSLSGRTLAQATTLTYGDSAQGTLSRSSSIVRYAFAAAAGDTVSIRATAVDKRALDLYLFLTDPFSDDIGFQDDSDGLDPALLNYYLPAAGRYTISVRANSGRGDFAISLELVNRAADRAILFEDDFSDNQNDWETGGKIIIGAVQDGKYVVDSDCRAQQYTWFTAPGFNDASLMPALDLNFVFEADVTIRKALGSAVVGLLFDVQQPGYKTASLLTYDSGGEWLYRLYNSDQNDFTVLSSNQSNSINLADGETHRLGISATESEIRFWIDGQHITRTPRRNGLVGTVGLDAGCGRENSVDVVHAEFDNVLVTLSPFTFTSPDDTSI
jgi:hypothetical protein